MSINLTDEIEIKTKKGKLGAVKQIFLEGDTTSLQESHEDNQAHFDTLDNRSSQMEESIKNISVTGGHLWLMLLPTITQLVVLKR